jgi:hypothetical protein
MTASSPSGHQNGHSVKVRKPFWMEIDDEQWTMNNELFIVYRLTFMVLTGVVTLTLERRVVIFQERDESARRHALS